MSIEHPIPVWPPDPAWRASHAYAMAHVDLGKTCTLAGNVADGMAYFRDGLAEEIAAVGLLPEEDKAQWYGVLCCSASCLAVAGGLAQEAADWARMGLAADPADAAIRAMLEQALANALHAGAS